MVFDFCFSFFSSIEFHILSKGDNVVVAVSLGVLLCLCPNPFNRVKLTMIREVPDVLVEGRKTGDVAPDSGMAIFLTK